MVMAFGCVAFLVSVFLTEVAELALGSGMQTSATDADVASRMGHGGPLWRRSC